MRRRLLSAVWHSAAMYAAAAWRGALKMAKFKEMLDADPELLAVERGYLYNVGKGRLPGFLTAQGSFGTYTKTIKKATDDLYSRCHVSDLPEHVICDCRRWNRMRREVWREIGIIPDAVTIIGFMLREENDWNLINDYITEVTRTKENEDSELQGSAQGKRKIEKRAE
ncbi:hypothetical protein WA026_015836 [Henosepilachna vigintioctopunctata]|uniref:Uncharacterized protein n=1 Tax=Henosepilachna vigintioctopunctata TaxID=420089 RepID=A0AAW1UT38_9CUCU